MPEWEEVPEWAESLDGHKVRSACWLETLVAEWWGPLDDHEEMTPQLSPHDAGERGPRQRVHASAPRLTRAQVDNAPERESEAKKNRHELPDQPCGGAEETRCGGSSQGKEDRDRTSSDRCARDREVEWDHADACDLQHRRACAWHGADHREGGAVLEERLG